MVVDRYVKIVLTVIALELFWIGIKDAGAPVSAQAQPQVTPVVIRGIEMRAGDGGFLPVIAARPLRIDDARPLKVDVDRPVLVENERPLLVESVPYSPTARPGR